MILLAKCPCRTRLKIKMLTPTAMTRESYTKNCMAFARDAPHYCENVPTSATESRILSLCHKVVALPTGSNEFEPTIRELKTALHEQLEEARTKVAEMALMVASQYDSRATD